MATHNDLGIQGEQIAKDYLMQNDYEILDENWTHLKSEIDIIAYQHQKIIFIEVKTRSSTAFGQPEDFVSKAKQKQMELASAEYIELMNHQGEIRFDIIAILFNPQNKYTLKHIEDAFWPEN